MYTGRMIDELIEAVAKAEEHADLQEHEFFFTQADLEQFSYSEQLAGVA